MKRIMKRILIGLILSIVVLFIALVIYSRNPYTALDEMTDQIMTRLTEDDVINYTLHIDGDQITYTVAEPKKNIIIIPGGLVTPDSYEYLALGLALEGYNVTIAKAPFNLAILHPTIGKEFIDESLDNVVIGHSLGGVTASNVFSNNVDVDEVILMGSYPINDLTNQDVLFISAEHDIAMDQEAFEDSFKYVSGEANVIDIEGGNHAQFGWYGPQKGDGDAEIDTLTQQEMIIELIIAFIK